MFQLSWHHQDLCFSKTCVLLSQKCLLSLTHLHLPLRLLVGQQQDCRVLHQPWLWMRNLNLLNHLNTPHEFGPDSTKFKYSIFVMVLMKIGSSEESSYLRVNGSTLLLCCPLENEFWGLDFHFSLKHCTVVFAPICS